MTYSVSTIGCLQSVLSTQPLEFTTLLDQGVQEHTTHLNEKYKQFSTDYEELYRMVMDMKSQVGGTCVPSYWPHSPGDYQPPPLAPLIF
jgi:hypothetical protein